MPSISSVLTIFASIFYLILLFMVFTGKIETRLKILFLTYLASMLIVQVSLFLVTVSTDKSKADVYYTIISAAFVAYIGLFFPLARRFTGNTKGKIPTVLSLVVTVLTLIFSFFGSFIGELYGGEGGFLVPRIELSAVLLFLPLLGFWVWGIIILVLSYLRTDSLYQKNRLKYLLIGSFVVLLGGLSNLTPLKEFPFDVFCFMLNAVLFGNAILRHRVLNIKTALKKGVFNFAIVTGFFLLYFFFYKVSLFALELKANPLVAGMISFFIVLLAAAFGFRKINVFFISLFFRERRDFQISLNQFSRAMITLLTPRQIFEQLESTLEYIYNIESFYVYQNNTKKKDFRLTFPAGSESAKNSSLGPMEGNAFARFLFEVKSPVWMDELLGEKKQTELSDVFSCFSTDAVPDIAFPLFDDEEMRAIVCFREKHSGRIFDQGDMGFLAILSNLTSAALSKANVFEDLGNSLREKEILLKEVHHRVKNNLQLISSLIELQKDKNGGDMAKHFFSSMQGRIASIANVHESIYISDNLSRINSKDYIESLVRDLQSQYGENYTVTINFDLEDIYLSIREAVPFGLIINELITNAFKHAFPISGKGELTIQTRSAAGNCIFRIKDNGPGFRKSNRPKSLGMVIVGALVEEQLEGEWRINNQAGTEHVISFPLP